MSYERVPSRSEVMGWSPQHLADYLRRMNLSGSDNIVLHFSINGPRFVNMTENDFQKFPKLHAPMIAKLCSQINKKDERGLFNKKPTAFKYREPDTPVEDVGWGDDFDSDDDYEEPDANDANDYNSVGDYESPTEDHDYEPNPSESTDDLSHLVGPSRRIGGGEYIDNLPSSRGPPPIVSPRPSDHTHLVPSHKTVPSLERRDVSPFRGNQGNQEPGRGPGPPPPPIVERNKKPTREREATHSPVQGIKVNTLEKHLPTPGRLQERNQEPSGWPKPPVPPVASSSVSRSNSTAARPPPGRFPPEMRGEAQNQGPAARNHTFPRETPVLQNRGFPPIPGIPGLRPRFTESLPPNIPYGGSLSHNQRNVSASSVNTSSVGQSPHAAPLRASLVGTSASPNSTQRSQDLDPSWYVGRITRSQADHRLRQVVKDGAYLVRDSKKQQLNQPFTLMVLYQDKVYNLQIRKHNREYQLGTSVQESFPSVSAMICHYAQTPLLLIDANNRGMGQLNQCLLSDPAGH